MKDDDINVQLFRTLKKMEPNKVFKLGEYPSRMKPKNILAKNQVDLNKPIVKPRRMTESNLSFENILKQL
jgi:hypothetical protein